jgi:predicted ATP-grasp superfamily ATP-dependent carboligase
VVKAVGLSRGLPVVRVAETDEELRAILAPIPPEDRLIVQEVLSGPLVGLSLVLDRAGEVVARFQQVARRVWPVPAGGSSLAVSVAPDEDLVARAAAMLVGIGFWGLAQLQFLTGRDGGAALIDVNPRFYGSMPLATAAGVNLPAAWQAVATEAPLPAPGPYRVGTVYRWLEGDITAAYNGFRAHLRREGVRPDVGAMWAADDPVPAALLAAEATWLRVRRRLPASPWA